jgi:YHS domain-containing protein
MRWSMRWSMRRLMVSPGRRSRLRRAMENLLRYLGHWIVRLVCLGLGLGLCSSTVLARPFDTILDGRDERIMLGGNDPVAYQRLQRAVPGRPELRVEYEGVVYRFSSPTFREEFIRDPARWTPAFGGHCAQSMAHALPVAARAEVFEIIDGRLHLFSSERARGWFLMDRERNLELAQRWWRDEVAGSSLLLQRAWRMVVPVPNRRAPEDLERDYRERLHGGRSSGAQP